MNTPDADRAAIRDFVAGGRQPLAVNANPMAQALGMTLLAVDEQRGRVRLAFNPAPHFAQGTGVLQGGAVAGILDFAMAFATMALLGEGESIATVNLNTSLIRAVPLGPCFAEGEVERRGKSLAFARANLHATEAASEPLATATSVLALRR